jgi:hypothetical protein
MRISKKTLAGMISAALLISAPAASAVTSAQSGYSTVGGTVQTEIDSSPPPGTVETKTSTRSDNAVTQTTAKAKDSGSLPFTGLDLALVVAAGGILLAVGLGMRRISRPTSPA